MRIGHRTLSNQKPDLHFSDCFLNLKIPNHKAVQRALKIHKPTNKIKNLIIYLGDRFNNLDRKQDLVTG